MLKLLLLQILAVGNSSSLAAMRFETVTETSGSMGMAAVTSRSQTTYTGDRSRIDFLESSMPRPTMQAGTYMLAGSGHFYVIDSTKRQYYDMDIAKMQASASAMLKQMPGLQMKFSDFKFDAQDLGDGETLLGHPTRHWRVSGTITINGVMDHDTIAVSTEVVHDHFFAKDFEMVKALPQLSGDSSAMTQFGDVIPAAMLANMRNALARMPRSIDLKSENKMTSYFGPMDVAITSTARVTRIESVNVDAAYFEIPSGYKKVEMPSPTSPPGSM